MDKEKLTILQMSHYVENEHNDFVVNNCVLIQRNHRSTICFSVIGKAQKYELLKPCTVGKLVGRSVGLFICLSFGRLVVKRVDR